MEPPVQPVDSDPQKERIRGIANSIREETLRIMREQGLDTVYHPNGNGDQKPTPQPKRGLDALPSLLSEFATPPVVPEPEPVPEVAPPPVVEAGFGGRVLNELDRSQLTLRRDVALDQLTQFLENEQLGLKSTVKNGTVLDSKFLPGITEEEFQSQKRDLFNTVIELTSQSQQIPTGEVLKKFQDAEGLGELFGTIVKNPSVLIESAASSSLQSLPSVFTTAIGSAVAGPAGAAIGSFLGSMGTEEVSAFTGFLQDEGYDLTNPESILSALQNDTLREELQSKARRKGLGVAVTEGIFGAGLGKLVKASGVGTVGKEVLGTVSETVGEGTGEAVGAFLAGEDVSLVDAARESLSSLPQGSATAAATIAGEKLKGGSKTPAQPGSQTPTTPAQQGSQTQGDTQQSLPTPVNFSEGSVDFEMNGTPYQDPSVNQDSDGNPVSVTVTNPDGTRETISDVDLANTVFSRMEEIDNQTTSQGEAQNEEVQQGDGTSQVDQVEAGQGQTADQTQTEEVTQDENVGEDTRTAVEREIDQIRSQSEVEQTVRVTSDESVEIGGETYRIESLDQDPETGDVNTATLNKDGERIVIDDPQVAAQIALQQNKFVVEDFAQLETDVTDFVNEVLQGQDVETTDQVFNSLDDRTESVFNAVFDGKPVTELDVQHARDQILTGLQVAEEIQDVEVRNRVKNELFSLNDSLNDAELSDIDAVTREELEQNISDIQKNIDEIFSGSPEVEAFVNEGLTEAHGTTLDKINNSQFDEIGVLEFNDLELAVNNLVESATGLPDEFGENLVPFLNELQKEVQSVREVLNGRFENEVATTPQTPDEIAAQTGNVETGETGTSAQNRDGNVNRETQSEGQPENGGQNPQESGIDSVVNDGVTPEPEPEVVTPSVQKPIDAKTEPIPDGSQVNVDPKTGDTFTSPEIKPQPKVPDNSPTRDDVRAAVDATVSKFALENKVNIAVLDSVEMAGVVGLDPRKLSFTDSQGRTVGTAAVYLPQDNRVVFFADMLDGDNLQADVEQLFAEEVVTHMGLRALLGSEFVTIMSRFYDALDTALLTDTVDLYRDQLRDVDGKPVTATTRQIVSGKVKLNNVSKSLLVEEFFGQVAADNASNLTPTKRNFLQQILDSLKLLFNKLGFNNIASLEDEIKNLLVLSAENLRRTNGVLPAKVSVATSRVRIASERDQARANAIRTFGETMTGEEQVQVLNNIIPPRLASLLNQVGVPQTPSENLAILSIVKGYISNISTEPVDISENVYYGTSEPFNDAVVTKATEEMLNGVTSLQSFNGVADTGGMKSQERVVALHAQTTGRIIRGRREATLGKRAPINPKVGNVHGVVESNPTSTPLDDVAVAEGDAGLVGGTNVRHVRETYPESEGWKKVRVTGMTGTRVRFRPEPYTFHSVKGRRGVGDSGVQGWIGTLSGRVKEVVDNIPDNLKPVIGWVSQTRSMLVSKYGVAGDVFMDVLLGSNTQVPIGISPSEISELFGRFITGEFDGVLNIYAPFLEYVELENVRVNLRNQLDAAQDKLNTLNSARESRTDETLIRELTDESIRVGGFDNLVNALTKELESVPQVSNPPINRKGGYGGAVIPSKHGRGIEPVMRAMVNMYHTSTQERGTETLMGNPSTTTVEKWVVRGLQRLAGDPMIAPVSEDVVTTQQREFVSQIMENVGDKSARDILFLTERQNWSPEYASILDIPQTSIRPPLVSPVTMTREGTNHGHTETGSGREATMVEVENDDNVYSTAIDAITQAKDLGHKVVVVAATVDDATPTTRFGTRIDFTKPVSLDVAKQLVGETPNVTFIGAQANRSTGKVSGVQFIDLDGNEFTPNLGFNVTDGFITQVEMKAEELGVGIAEMDVNLYDVNVINEEKYDSERERLSTIADEQDGITPESDRKQRKGGTWGQSVVEKVKGREQKDGQKDHSDNAEIGRNASHVATQEIAMGSILTRMGFKNVGTEGVSAVAAYETDMARINDAFRITDVVGTNRDEVREQLIEVARELGYDITFDVGNGTPNPNGVDPVSLYSHELGLGNNITGVISDVLVTTRYIAERQTPINPNPILRTDAVLKNQRELLSALTGEKIKARPFSVLYQYEMSVALASALGISDTVVRGIPKSQTGKSIKFLKSEAEAIFNEARKYTEGGIDPSTVRFNRRIRNNNYDRTLWVDGNTPRRTPRDLSTVELGSHPEYAPENAATTQRSNTSETYRKIGDIITPGGTVLDYGGGLGVGTRVLRDAGFNTTLYEPFPNDSGRQVVEPDASKLDGSDLDGQYDTVINSMVLNVVPQDTRDHIVRSIGDRVKVGGEAIFTVREWRGDVDRSIKNENNKDLGNGQVLIGSTGAYQKGFEKQEVVAYIQDVLGPSFEVSRIKVGSALAVRARKLNDLKRSARSTNPEFVKRQFDEAQVVGGDPVITDAGDVFSSNIPEDFQKLITDFKDEFGITKPVYLMEVGKGYQLSGYVRSTGNDVVARVIETDVSDVVSDGDSGAARDAGLAYIVYLNPERNNLDIKSFATSETLLHELGHVLDSHLQETYSEEYRELREVHKRYKESIQNTPLRDVFQDYRLYGNSLQILAGIVDDGKVKNTSDQQVQAFLEMPVREFKQVKRDYYNYVFSFDEWFADQFSKWSATVPSQRESGLIDRAMSRLSTWLRRLYELVGLSGIRPDPTFEEFINKYSKYQNTPNSVDGLRSSKQDIQPRFHRRFINSPQEASDFNRRTQDAIRGRRVPNGRPDLANPGRDEMSRLIVDQVDEIRNERGDPEVQHIADVKPGAIARVDADPIGERTRLVRDGISNMEDQLVAEELIHRLMTGANPNSQSEIVEIGKLINDYRNARGDTARALAAGYDPTLTPAQRNQRYIIHALMTPPQEMRRRLDAANTQDEINKIWDDYHKRVRDIVSSLANQGINVHQLTDLELKDMAKLMEIMRTIQAHESSVGDKLYEYWINAILSAPTTHLANIIGNVGNTTWEFLVQRTLEATINSVTGNRFDGTTMGEMKAIGKALSGGFGPIFSTALRRANIAYHIEQPVLESEIGQESASKLDVMKRAIGDYITVPFSGGKKKIRVNNFGRNIRIPTRLLLWTDEFLKSITFQLEAAALAYRSATKDGLKGDQLQSRIAHILSNPQATEFNDIFENAFYKARHLAFQDPLKSRLLKDLAKKESSNDRVDLLSNVLKWFIPFVSTPTNILKQGVKRTPVLGAIRIGGKLVGHLRYLQDPAKTTLRYDSDERFRDIVEQTAAMGMALMLTAIVGGQDDDDPWITGSEADYLTNRGEAELDRRSVPPLSIRFPWTDTYFSYQRIEPFATSLAVTVDMAHAIKQKVVNGQSIDKGFGDFVDTMRGLVKDKSFFQGISNLLELMEGGPNKVSNFAVNTVSSFSPNVIRRAASSLDPVYRDNRVRGEGLEYWKQLAQRTGQKAFPLPAFSQAAKVDLWGRPAEKTPDALNSPFSNFMIGMFSPGYIASRDRVLPVDRMMKNYLLQNPNSEKQLPLPIAPDDEFKWMGKTITLTDEEYNRYATLAGETLYAMVQYYPFNIDHPSEMDIEMIRNTYTSAKKMAQNQVVQEMINSGSLDLNTLE